MTKLYNYGEILSALNIIYNDMRRFGTYDAESDKMTFHESMTKRQKTYLKNSINYLKEIDIDNLYNTCDDESIVLEIFYHITILYKLKVLK